MCRSRICCASRDAPTPPASILEIRSKPTILSNIPEIYSKPTSLSYIFEIHSTPISLSYIFDIVHFRDAIETNPPIIHAHPPCAEAPYSTGVPRSKETPTPLGSPCVPRHRATVGSYRGGVSHERGTPVGSSARHEPVASPGLRVQGRPEGSGLRMKRLTATGAQPNPTTCQRAPRRTRRSPATASCPAKTDPRRARAMA